MRIFCLAYALLLSLLLLSSDPISAVGQREGYSGLLTLKPFAHFLGFVPLAFFTVSARWPISRTAAAICLVGYAAGTELLQCFVPGREPGVLDLLQNVVGIAVGGLLAAVMVRDPRHGTPSQARHEVDAKGLSRSPDR